ncbi:hypothetical protein ACJ72_03132, partial [Emergomyces africanus]
IAAYLKSATSPSIDRVIEHLTDKDLIRLEDTIESLNSARLFVFAILGWQTMLYMPSLGTCPPGQLAVADEQNGFRGGAFMQLRQDLFCSRHDLPEFLMGFGILLPAKNLCLAVDTEERLAFDRLDKITPRDFNASLISTIGHLQIKWVDILSCHMEFDPITKKLYLFRFPSYCQASLDCKEGDREDSHGHKSVIHSCATTRGDLREWAATREVDLFMAEILLSYRLLFGQTNTSRRFFRQTAPFKGLPKNVHDLLLAHLCGTKEGYVSEYADTVEQDVYDLAEHFPILRSRIVALHSHMGRATTKTWSELWRDKRDSAQWLTFWALLVFGGLGLLFSFLQVLLQAVQLGLGR